MREITRIVVHCADTPATMDIGAAEIRNWHVNGNGWSDIGYHYVIRRDGTIETGRDRDHDGDIDEEIGAHVAGHNSNTIGICMVGGKGASGRPECNFTANQWSSLESLISDLTARYDTITDVCGHRDLDPHKACPTFDVRAWWAAR